MSEYLRCDRFIISHARRLWALGPSVNLLHIMCIEPALYCVHLLRCLHKAYIIAQRQGPVPCVNHRPCYLAWVLTYDLEPGRVSLLLSAHKTLKLAATVATASVPTSTPCANWLGVAAIWYKHLNRDRQV